MSYYVVPSQPRSQPYHMNLAMRPLPALAQVPLPTSLPSPTAGMPNWKKVLIGLAILAALVALLVWLDKQRRSGQRIQRNQAVKRLSTPELAKRLYSRLEKRGKANKTTLRSLSYLAKGR